MKFRLFFLCFLLFSLISVQAQDVHVDRYESGFIDFSIELPEHHFLFVQEMDELADLQILNISNSLVPLGAMEYNPDWKGLWLCSIFSMKPDFIAQVISQDMEKEFSGEISDEDLLNHILEDRADSRYTEPVSRNIGGHRVLFSYVRRKNRQNDSICMLAGLEEDEERVYITFDVEAGKIPLYFPALERLMRGMSFKLNS